MEEKESSTGDKDSGKDKDDITMEQIIANQKIQIVLKNEKIAGLENKIDELTKLLREKETEIEKLKRKQEKQGKQINPSKNNAHERKELVHEKNRGESLDQASLLHVQQDSQPLKEQEKDCPNRVDPDQEKKDLPRTEDFGQVHQEESKSEQGKSPESKSKEKDPKQRKKSKKEKKGEGNPSLHSFDFNSTY